jgi:hypothetical protein
MTKVEREWQGNFILLQRESVPQGQRVLPRIIEWERSALRTKLFTWKTTRMYDKPNAEKFLKKI